jgi:hypothetical protein
MLASMPRQSATVEEDDWASAAVALPAAARRIAATRPPGLFAFMFGFSDATQDLGETPDKKRPHHDTGHRRRRVDLASLLRAE